MGNVLEAGAEIAGYRVLRQLGRGGVGLVYEVEHLRLGRRAALKLLTPGFSGNEGFQARFVQESRLIAAIDHPNIVPIYDAGDADGTLYLAMRLVSGGDLGVLIAREGSLPAERAVEVVEQVAAALDAAHARDIVHRDVKPANILFDGPTDRVYLTDFGVAKSAAPGLQTREGVFVGTVGYAAPEQIESREVGAATDVYALGCVLYECLAGRPPFVKPTDVAVIFAHIRDEPPRVTAVRPDLPPEIDEVIVRALAKAPGGRYRSAGELAAAARAALGLSAATSVGPAWSQPTAAEPRRERERPRLPVPATPIVGRQAELAAAEGLLLDHGVRLLSLTGPGGTGKTRLALETAGAVAPRFPGGVYFVGLDAVGDAGLVVAAIAEVVGDAEASVESLAARLAGKPTLLVLDNFEHVLPASPLVADLLADAPGVTVLVTSRAALRVRGEQELPVSPLSLPGPADERSPAALAASAAVSLFVDRARAVRPDFELDDANAGSIAEICIRLDGLPLAIELAAARVKLLPVDAILARLDSRLALLTSGARDLPPRHQTIRSTIDWSYELLDPVTRTLLARLAVFQGGCTVEAAESICAAPGDVDPALVLDCMSVLVDGSLLSRREGAAGAGRFELLKTIQEFALYHLLERGEVDELRAAHARYYLALAESAGPELLGSDQARWLGLLEDESGNLRAAMGWSLDSGELDVGLRIAGALPRFWSVRGLMGEGRVWLDRALSSDRGGDRSVRASALFAAGYAALGQGDYADAASRFEESLHAARQGGDVVAEAACLAQLGWLLAACGSVDRADDVSHQSLALAAALGDTRTVALARANLADVAARRGDHGQAATLLEGSLALRRQLGDERNVASTLLELARVELLRDRAQAAVRLVDEAHELAREVGDTWSLAVSSATLGRVALDRGDRGEARRSFEWALATSWRRGDKRVTAESLLGIAAVAAADGERGTAARLWGAATALRDALGASASPTERSLEERYLEPLRASFGSEAFGLEHDAGLRLTPEQAAALAIGAG